MKTILLNESDRNLAAQALQLAGSEYRKIADTLSAPTQLHKEMRAQFIKQAEQAERIGQLIWDANTVGLSVEEDMRHDEETWSEGDMQCECGPTTKLPREWHDTACPLSGSDARCKAACDQCGGWHGSDPSEDDCDCSDRSWYGEYHDSACPLAGQAR